MPSVHHQLPARLQDDLPQRSVGMEEHRPRGLIHIGPQEKEALPTEDTPEPLEFGTQFNRIRASEEGSLLDEQILVRKQLALLNIPRGRRRQHDPASLWSSGETVDQEGLPGEHPAEAANDASAGSLGLQLHTLLCYHRPGLGSDNLVWLQVDGEEGIARTELDLGIHRDTSEA